MLRVVSFVFCMFRRLYLQGKISRDLWLELNDEFTQLITEEFLK